MAEGEAITSRGAANDEAGFTLIEVMVALGLMAVISLAGLSLLQGIVVARERTDGRLARLGAQQRAMFVLTQDLEQISVGPLIFDGRAVSFHRQGAGPQAGRLPVSYGFDGAVLQRQVGGGAPQTLVTDVTAVQWSFFDGGGWRDGWPPAEAAQAEWPRAVSLEVTLAASEQGPGGHLRRVVALPTRPRP